MASEFPLSLDEFRNPTPETETNDPGFGHAEQHTNANDAIEALQAKVGIDASANPASLDYRMAEVESGKQPALGYTPENVANKGTSGGYAGLDGAGKVPAAQLPTTDAVTEGAANLYHTAQRVRDAILTGLSTATNAVIAATDSVLVALGKLQAQVSARVLNTGDSMTGPLNITASTTPQVLAVTGSYKDATQVIPNSEFADASSWTLSGGWQISGGVLSNPTAVAGNISVPLTGLVAGASYVIEVGMLAQTVYFTPSSDGGTTKKCYWRSWEAGSHFGFVAPSSNFTLTLSTEYVTGAVQIDYIRMYKIVSNAERVQQGSSGSAATFDLVASGTSFGLGPNSLKNSGAAQNSVGIGNNALAAAVRPYSCIAIGSGAMRYSASPAENIGIGSAALQNLTVGSGNTILGNEAGAALTTGALNVGIGPRALQAATTANYNFAIGDGALVQLTTGHDNVAIGLSAGQVINGGGISNTLVGSRIMRNGTVRDYTSITALGYGAAGTTYYSNSVCLGHGAVVTGAAQLQLGASGFTTYAYGAVQDRSDRRDKTDIRPTVLGLKFINALTPVDFRWDMRDDYRAEMPEEISDRLSFLASERPKIAEAGGDVASIDAEIADLQAQVEEIAKDNTLKNIRRTRDMRRRRYHHGLIAQDVRQVMTALDVDFGGFQDHSLNGGDDVLSLGYTELIAPLIRAVQEQQEMIDALSARLAKFEKGN